MNSPESGPALLDVSLKLVSDAHHLHSTYACFGMLYALAQEIVADAAAEEKRLLLRFRYARLSCASNIGGVSHLFPASSQSSTKIFDTSTVNSNFILGAVIFLLASRSETSLSTLAA